MTKSLPLDHVIKAQRFITDSMVVALSSLVNVMVCWSAIPPSLVVRGLFKLEIKPQMLTRQSSSHNLSIICMVGVVHTFINPLTTISPSMVVKGFIKVEIKS